MEGLNTGDISFLIFSTALVMFMVPGLALFYGGLVKSKNVLSTIMHSYAALFIISIQWIVIGYSLTFSSDIKGIIGDLNWAFLNNFDFFTANAKYADSVPHLLFVIFQMMFAIITIAVVSGSFAERMRFPAFLVFALLWSTLVYDPIAHWVWSSSGWLNRLGVLDFAGGNVVEINSGVSGLVTALFLGKRKRTKPEPHHIPMAILGGGILWFGWFGFNAGSALHANGVAVVALLNTNTSAAAGAIGWVICEWLITKKPTVLGAMGGAIAGLVAITQGAGFVTPMAAIPIGLIGGIASYFAIGFMKVKLGYDDALDAFGCHGIGGIWGAIATGIFATTLVNKNGNNGLLYGNPGLLGVHLLAIFSCALYAGVMTFLILKVMSLFMKIRTDKDQESVGLDVSLHGEEAYNGFNI
ncbi:MAG: ammonium transporter [Clostridiaceae bacterium]|nr:ammonium transporter [Clostridiaceae bacterium]